MASVWNEALIEELKTLWTSGWSAKLIAEKLGFTRNSVIGKVFRLKLPDRQLTRTADKPVRAKKPKPGQRIITRIQSSNGNSNSLRVIQTIETEQYKLRSVELVPLNISLIDLEQHHCRYPYDGENGPTTYCGHNKMAGSSYCVPHKFLCQEQPYGRRAAA